MAHNQEATGLLRETSTEPATQKRSATLLICLGPHWKHPVANKAGGFVCEEEKNQIPVPEFLFKMGIKPI